MKGTTTLRLNKELAKQTPWTQRKADKSVGVDFLAFLDFFPKTELALWGSDGLLKDPVVIAGFLGGPRNAQVAANMQSKSMSPSKTHCKS